jgi:hypothetical protein
MTPGRAYRDASLSIFGIITAISVPSAITCSAIRRAPPIAIAIFRSSAAGSRSRAAAFPVIVILARDDGSRQRIAVTGALQQRCAGRRKAGGRNAALPRALDALSRRAAPPSTSSIRFASSASQSP